MWFDRLTLPARLRRLYREAAPTDMSPGTDTLESRLLAEHAVRFPARAPAGLRGFAAARRWALAGVGLGLATVGACQVPVDYEREFGASVTCELPPEAWPEGQVDRIAHGLADELGAEGLALRVHHGDGEMMRFRVDLWGVEIDDDELIAALHSRASEIPVSACTRTPLAGTVHGTLGGRLGLRFLDLDLDHEDAESTRLQILEQLAQQGVEGDANVEIRQNDDGKREVQVRVRVHRP